MRIVFADGNNDIDQNAQYVNFSNREVTPTRYTDDSSFQELGPFSSVRWMIGNLRMIDFYAMVSLRYVKLTYEFLSSFHYITPFAEGRLTITAKFRMFHRSFVMNRNEIIDLLHFPHGEGWICESPLDSE